ncbi:hypothetical protein ACOMHN_022193 [Nucella lapillus]
MAVQPVMRDYDVLKNCCCRSLSVVLYVQRAQELMLEILQPRDPPQPGLTLIDISQVKTSMHQLGQQNSQHAPTTGVRLGPTTAAEPNDQLWQQKSTTNCSSKTQRPTTPAKPNDQPHQKNTTTNLSTKTQRPTTSAKPNDQPQQQNPTTNHISKTQRPTTEKPNDQPQQQNPTTNHSSKTQRPTTAANPKTNYSSKTQRPTTEAKPNDQLQKEKPTTNHSTKAQRPTTAAKPNNYRSKTQRPTTEAKPNDQLQKQNPVNNYRSKTQRPTIEAKPNDQLRQINLTTSFKSETPKDLIKMVCSARTIKRTSANINSQLCDPSTPRTLEPEEVFACVLSLHNSEEPELHPGVGYRGSRPAPPLLRSRISPCEMDRRVDSALLGYSLTAWPSTGVRPVRSA